MLGNQPVRHGVMFAIVPMLPRWGFDFPLSLAEGFFHCLAASSSGGSASRDGSRALSRGS